MAMNINLQVFLVFIIAQVSTISTSSWKVHEIPTMGKLLP
jgi:hypothetical protein